MIHPRIQLVTADYVATVHGLSVEAITRQVDGGGNRAANEPPFLWVFNIGTVVEEKRCLRFWSREIEHPLAVQKMSLDEVIHYLIPARNAIPNQTPMFRNWEVGELLRVPRGTLINLRQELRAVEINGGVCVPRSALADFFRRRWCYAATTTLNHR